MYLRFKNVHQASKWRRMLKMVGWIVRECRNYAVNWICFSLIFWLLLFFFSFFFATAKFGYTVISLWFCCEILLLRRDFHCLFRLFAFESDINILNSFGLPQVVVTERVFSILCRKVCMSHERWLENKYVQVKHSERFLLCTHIYCALCTWAGFACDPALQTVRLEKHNLIQIGLPSHSLLVFRSIYVFVFFYCGLNSIMQRFLSFVWMMAQPKPLIVLDFDYIIMMTLFCVCFSMRTKRKLFSWVDIFKHKTNVYNITA